MIKKYITFWNVYLAVIFVFIFSASLLFYAVSGNGGGIIILPFLYTTIGILLLSKKLLNSINKIHIIVLFLIFIISYPVLDFGKLNIMNYFGFMLIIWPIFIIPIFIIWIFHYLIKEIFNVKKSNIILLTLYLIIALSPISSPVLIYVIGIDPLIGGLGPIFALFLIIFIITDLIFFEKDKAVIMDYANAIVDYYITTDKDNISKKGLDSMINGWNNRLNDMLLRLTDKNNKPLYTKDEVNKFNIYAKNEIEKYKASPEYTDYKLRKNGGK